MATTPLKRFLGGGIRATRRAERSWISFAGIPLPRRLLGIREQNPPGAQIWSDGFSQRRRALREKESLRANKIVVRHLFFTQGLWRRAVFGGFDAHVINWIAWLPEPDFPHRHLTQRKITMVSRIFRGTVNSLDTFSPSTQLPSRISPQSSCDMTFFNSLWIGYDLDPCTVWLLTQRLPAMAVLVK